MAFTEEDQSHLFSVPSARLGEVTYRMVLST